MKSGVTLFDNISNDFHARKKENFTNESNYRLKTQHELGLKLPAERSRT